MNLIDTRIIELTKVSAADASEIHDIFIEWCAVDTSEVSQRVIDKALKEAYEMWSVGVTAYFANIEAQMKLGA